MKKLTLIISALALVLGMSQCRKPDVQSYAGIVKDITFNAVGNGAKGDFYQDGDKLKLNWQAGDKLYVYSSESSESFVVESGAYLGTMDIISGMGSEEATFKGTFEIAENVKYLRFVHVGKDITVDANGNASHSYSTQSGVIDEGENNVAKTVIAHIDLPVSGTEYSGALNTDYAIVEFKMSFFKGKNVTMTGYTNDKLTLGGNGSITASHSEATSISLGTISKNVYYLIVLPEATAPTYTFNDGTTNYVKVANNPVQAGLFYSNAGSPIPVVDDDVLPGVFTVKDKNGVVKRVHFSKGNLQYQASTNTWRFADNQYDTIGKKNVKISETYEGWIDLFGWGTGYATTAGGNASYPWQNNMWYGKTYKYYAVNYDKINDAVASVSNVYDWGHNIGDGNTWYTLSLEQWKWLLGPKSKDGDAPSPGTNCRNTSVTIGETTSTYRYALAKVDGICGLLVFPDEFEWDATTMGDAPTSINTHCADWNGEGYSLSEFEVMQEAGMLFLPAAGYRGDIDPENPRPVSVYKLNTSASYWSSSAYVGSAPAYARMLSFNVDNVNSHNMNYRCNGFSVRLVTDIPSGK